MVHARFSAIVALFLGASQLASAGVVKRVTCPTGQKTANAKCCALFPVIDLLQAELFDGGKCDEDAHFALRLSFHDAIGFSIHGGKGGGADGSILVFNQTETTYAANGGIDDITAIEYPFFQKSGLSAGDFLHLAAAVGTGNCPGAPRLKYMLGRPPPVAPAPDLTVPLPTDNITSILGRMADAGFSAKETVALLASHSVAAGHFVNPKVAFDSTPATFDSQFFLEVLLKGRSFPTNDTRGQELSPLAGEMRIDSDFGIAHDPRTACAWQAMINNQKLMASQFKNAMFKMQLLGHDPKDLTDCSDVIPIPKPFPGPIKYPASFSEKDVQKACTHLPFPSLATVPGPAPTVPPVS